VVTDMMPRPRSNERPWAVGILLYSMIRYTTKDITMRRYGSLIRFATYYSAVGAVEPSRNSSAVTGRDDLHGALATVRAYSLTVSDPENKNPATDHDKYMTVYKRQSDGAWKAVADDINSHVRSGRLALRAISNR